MSRIAKLIVIVIVLAMVGCSYENSATVTIDTGIRKQAQLSLIDKVIAWFSLSKAVQADPVPGQLQQQINKITLTVYASDMQAITQTIPLETGKITLEVPAGSQRTFEIVAGQQAVGAPSLTRYYGGIATVDLSPGQNVNLDIEMGELFTLPPNSYVSYSYGQINFSTNKDYHPLAFNIYQYVDNQWIFYTRLDSFNITYTSYFQITITIDTLSPGTYGIAGVNKYGEGEMYTFEVPY